MPGDFPMLANLPLLLMRRLAPDAQPGDVVLLALTRVTPLIPAILGVLLPAMRLL